MNHNGAKKHYTVVVKSIYPWLRFNIIFLNYSKANPKLTSLLIAVVIELVGSVLLYCLLHRQQFSLVFLVIARVIVSLFLCTCCFLPCNSNGLYRRKTQYLWVLQSTQKSWLTIHTLASLLDFLPSNGLCRRKTQYQISKWQFSKCNDNKVLQ